MNLPRSIAILSISLVIFFSISCSTANHEASDAYMQEVVTKGEIRSFHGSTLDFSGPLPFLKLKGNSYEQGLAYGVLLREELRASLEPFEQYQKAQSKLMPFYMRMFSKPYMNNMVNQFLKRTPQPYIDLMQGMADGAGGSLRMIALLQASNNANFSCTSALSQPTSNGGILHGRNLDFTPSLLGESPLLIKYENETAYDIWTIVNMGNLLLFHGCNEYGLSVSMNVLDDLKNGNRGMHISWKVMEILENAGSLNEADQIIRATKNDENNWLLILGSADEQKGRVYNLVNDLQAYKELQPEHPMIVFNESYEIPDAPVDEELRSNTFYFRTIMEHNRNRQKAAEAYYDHKPETPEEMWSILRNHDYSEQGTWHNRGTIANYSNMYSVVFDLNHQRMSFAAATSWASLRDVWELDLEKETFTLLLPADPYTQSERFLSNEASYLRITQQFLKGQLDFSDLDYRMGPYSQLGYGLHFRLFSPTKESLPYRDVLEQAAAEYPDLDLSYMCLGYYYRLLDPEKSIENFQKALEYPDMGLDFRVYTLQYMVDAYKKMGDKTGAAEAAAQWLELMQEYTQGYFVPANTSRLMNRMEKIAGL